MKNKTKGEDASNTAFTAVLDFFRELNVDNDALNSVRSQFKRMTFSAADVLLGQGDEQRYGYFILSGILSASYYSDVGDERSKEYYFSGELSFLYAAWLTNTPANYQIEALNNAEVVRVPLRLLNLPQWQCAKVELLQQQLLYKEAKEAFLLLNNPEERYLHLCQHSPQWINNLNNIQLAAYIGISPISLSRIKARMKTRLLT